MHLIRIPKASENMETATIGRWIKRQGQAVATGEPLVELVTDKADFEYESEVSGTLLRIVAAEKSMLPVGYVIALVGSPGEPQPDVSEENAKLMAQMRDVVAPAGGKPAAPPSAAGRRVAAKPAARLLAKQHSIDLGAVAEALAIQGVITEDDVRRYIEMAR
jgi:pyruvate/2-oxoglutarate dehydrogenase complex dihydrolipoamide acyltransferase (E2) component